MNTLDDLSQVFQALADPTRLGILFRLRDGELCASDLIADLGMSQPRVARHLKILVDAGLLRARRDGRFVFYRVEADGALGRLAAAVLRSIDAVGDRAGLPAAHAPGADAPGRASRSVAVSTSASGAGQPTSAAIPADAAVEPEADDRPGDIEDFLL
jgi:DNA-binding transcriptional ArsR family regulator